MTSPLNQASMRTIGAARKSILGPPLVTSLVNAMHSKKSVNPHNGGRRIEAFSQAIGAANGNHPNTEGHTAAESAFLSQHKEDSHEMLDARHYGYRFVSPWTSTSRYTATASHDFPYHSLMEQPYTTTRSSGTTQNLVGSQILANDADWIPPMASLSAEFMAAQSDWDDTLENEITKPHFEMLKEDPYIEDWGEDLVDFDRVTGSTNKNNKKNELSDPIHSSMAFVGYDDCDLVMTAAAQH